MEELQEIEVEETVKRIYWDIVRGKKEPNIDAMIAKLIDTGTIFLRCYDGIIHIFIDCSDVFAWGCSDCQKIKYEEIPDLFSRFEKNPSLIYEWICLERNEQPQEPMIKWLKTNAAWTPTMEALPDNLYDKLLKEDLEKRNKYKNILLNSTKEEAILKIKELELIPQIASIDGVKIPISASYCDIRINLMLNNNIVTDLYIG